jgi:hypothetical protein
MYFSHKFFSFLQICIRKFIIFVILINFKLGSPEPLKMQGQNTVSGVSSIYTHSADINFCNQIPLILTSSS